MLIASSSPNGTGTVKRDRLVLPAEQPSALRRWEAVCCLL